MLFAVLCSIAHLHDSIFLSDPCYMLVDSTALVNICLGQLLVLVGVRSVMEDAGRKLKMGRQSLPAQ